MVFALVCGKVLLSWLAEMKTAIKQEEEPTRMRNCRLLKQGGRTCSFLSVIAFVFQEEV